MTAGTVIVLLGVILAVIDLFVPDRRLLAFGTILIGVGILVGGGQLVST